MKKNKLIYKKKEKEITKKKRRGKLFPQLDNINLYI